MAIQSAQVDIQISATQQALVGIANVSYPPKVSIAETFTNGTDPAQDQLDLVGSHRATMTGSQVSVDLSGGGLVDGNSAPIAPVEIVAIAIKAADANAGNVTIDTGVIANGWVAGIDGTAVLPPGGCLILFAPAGYVVTAGTADLIGLTGTTGDTVDVLVLGRSA